MAALSLCSSYHQQHHYFNYFPEEEDYQLTAASFPLLPTYIETEAVGLDAEMLALDHDQLQFNCLLPPQDYAIPEPLFEFDSDSLLPYFSSSDDHNLISLCPEIFPLDELESIHYSYYPAFQKPSVPPPPPPPPPASCDQNPDFFPCCWEPSLFPGFPAPEAVDFLDDIPAALLPVPKFEPPAEPVRFSIGRSGKEEEEVNKKQSNENGVTLSAQSIAARHRRRRITQKTQDLGKMIPGGNKMNTAEMFQAAAEYVKFLQAQISILQSMGSPQELIEVPKDLATLVTSPVVQQKLYSEEKCLVPTELLQNLAHRSEVQSKPLVIKEIDELLMHKQH